MAGQADLDFSFKMGGEAGYGIAQSGMIFSKACTRMGLHVFVNNEYPSLIRGGHNTVQIRVRAKPVPGHTETVSMVLALNRKTMDDHEKEVLPGGVILYDADDVKDTKKERGDVSYCHIPLLALAKEAGGERIMRNTVGLGAAAAFCGLDVGIMNQLIKEGLGKKGEALADTNIRAAKLGYDFAAKNYDTKAFGWKLSGRAGEPPKMLITGNEAMAMGAIRAGCKFLAAYPMTPASAIMHYFAANERECSLVMKHVEDEIAGINMAIGAANAGVRAMISTSGGGFSLQTEGLGLAAMTETPVVMIEVQRPGPATGLPTRTEQADLHFVINAHQGEFPRLVVVPGDAEECFYLTAEAFNWAERFQLPVIVMSDKYLAESFFSHEKFDQSRVTVNRGWIVGEDWLKAHQPFKRYFSTENGVSPRVIPGTAYGIHREPSDERDELGSIDEDPQVRKVQVERRLRKFASVQKEVPAPALHGPAGADVTLVVWGSTKGPAIEALELLEKQGVRANVMQFVYMWPFPEAAEGLLREAKRLVLVEGNATGQLGRLIRQQTGIKIEEKILRYDGRPLSAEYIRGGFTSLKGGRA